MKLPIGIMAAFLIATAPASAAEVSDRDRFTFGNGCLPTRLVVEYYQSKKADSLKLTQDAIETTVRSRLRGARLFTENRVLAGWTFLYINVHVAGAAYDIETSYNKRLRDVVLKQNGIATTWQEGTMGTHGNDSGYILGIIARHTDKFIDEYLRVNADAC